MENSYTIADLKREGELTEDQQTLSLAQRRAFMKLPLEERHRILAEQADAIAAAVEYQEFEN